MNLEVIWQSKVLLLHVEPPPPHSSTAPPHTWIKSEVEANENEEHICMSLAPEGGALGAWTQFNSDYAEVNGCPDISVKLLVLCRFTELMNRYLSLSLSHTDKGICLAARQMYFAFMRAYIMFDIKHLLNTASGSHSISVRLQFPRTYSFPVWRAS